MSNFIDGAAIEKMARRIAAIIPDEEISARFSAVARQSLLEDERCAVAADESDLISAPAWAREAAARGRTLHVFTPNPVAIRALQRAARALRDAQLELAELNEANISTLSTRDAMVRAFAAEMFAKLGRMSLEAMHEKARWVASEHRRRKRVIKAEKILFPQEEIYAAPGRAWRRIVSTAELARVGSEMRNCLAARSGRHASFAQRLERDMARFWVLRDDTERALMVAMTHAATAYLVEARGPRNATVAPDDPTLAVLMRARGLVQPRARADAALDGVTLRRLPGGVIVLGPEAAAPPAGRLRRRG